MDISYSADNYSEKEDSQQSSPTPAPESSASLVSGEAHSPSSLGSSYVQDQNLPQYSDLTTQQSPSGISLESFPEDISTVSGYTPTVSARESVEELNQSISVDNGSSLTDDSSQSEPTIAQWFDQSGMNQRISDMDDSTQARSKAESVKEAMLNAVRSMKASDIFPLEQNTAAVIVQNSRGGRQARHSQAQETLRSDFDETPEEPGPPVAQTQKRGRGVRDKPWQPREKTGLTVAELRKYARKQSLPLPYLTRQAPIDIFTGAPNILDLANWQSAAILLHGDKQGVFHCPVPHGCTMRPITDPSTFIQHVVIQHGVNWKVETVFTATHAEMRRPFLMCPQCRRIWSRTPLHGLNECIESGHMKLEHIWIPPGTRRALIEYCSKIATLRGVPYSAPSVSELATSTTPLSGDVTELLSPDDIGVSTTLSAESIPSLDRGTRRRTRQRTLIRDIQNTQLQLYPSGYTPAPAVSSSELELPRAIDFRLVPPVQTSTKLYSRAQKGAAPPEPSSEQLQCLYQQRADLTMQLQRQRTGFSVQYAGCQTQIRYLQEKLERLKGEYQEQVQMQETASLSQNVLQERIDFYLRTAAALTSEMSAGIYGQGGTRQ